MKLFFMHIPKTAGTSFRRFLERSVRELGGVVSLRGADGIWSDDSESYPSYAEFVAARGAGWRDCDLVCGHYPFHVVDFLHPDTTVITVLRDPLARTISHVKHQMALEWQLEGKCEPDVNQFLAAPRNSWFLRTIGNLAVKYLSCHADPELIVPAEDLSLDVAVANCCQTLFGFADELPAFQQRLSALFPGTSAREFDLGRDNESRDRFSVADLTPRNRALLDELNELDLLLEELMRRVLAARTGDSIKDEGRHAEPA